MHVNTEYRRDRGFPPGVDRLSIGQRLKQTVEDIHINTHTLLRQRLIRVDKTTPVRRRESAAASASDNSVSSRFGPSLLFAVATSVSARSPLAGGRRTGKSRSEDAGTGRWLERRGPHLAWASWRETKGRAYNNSRKYTPENVKQSRKLSQSLYRADGQADRSRGGGQKANQNLRQGHFHTTRHHTARCWHAGRGRSLDDIWTHFSGRFFGLGHVVKLQRFSCCSRQEARAKPAFPGRHSLKPPRCARFYVHTL